MTELKFKEAQERILLWAKEKGWMDRKVEIPEQVALIHSEASEALEAWRNNEPVIWSDDQGKPQGIGSEYADIVIRCLHYAGLNGFDLGEEVAKKMDYNDTRARRHGGKAG